MIAYIEGRLVEVGSDRAVVDVGGVALAASIPLSTRHRLPEVGAQCRLLTRLIWREDGAQLFGFSVREEAEIFDLLIRVSGVGPRIAVAILSAASPAAILDALVRQDVDALRRYPGVGRKTAERILLELKDRVSAELLPDPDGVAAAGTRTAETVAGQAVQGLVGLGYSRVEGQAAVESVMRQGAADETSAGELIRRALQYLAAR